MFIITTALWSETFVDRREAEFCYLNILYVLIKFVPSGWLLTAYGTYN